MSEQESRPLSATGVVVAVEGEYVMVETQRQSGCGGCQSEGHCGTSALSKLFSGVGSAPIKVLNTQNAQPGDQVVLELDESQLLLHAFMAYGLPLVGLFVCAVGLKVLSQSLYPDETLNDLASVLGGGVGLMLGWWITRRFYHAKAPVLTHVLHEVGRNGSRSKT